MTYAISNVIYGRPLSDEAISLIEEWDYADSNFDRKKDPRLKGITLVYYQSLQRFERRTIRKRRMVVDYGYCGVLLGRFDETQTNMRFDKSNVQLLFDGGHCPLYPTHEQEDEAKRLLDSLHPDMKKAMEGSPGVYFVFNSS